ncbi:aldolase [Bordetella trematum]|uniref:Aldolase n=1 Tax=Bordetella trematum TaxID=123899 RepID=A0A157Q0I2_9BORD|nr:aldolase [Bordetella trematum]AUL46977.1 aldolase [Bordetella trematum]AZR93778.1 aldolase [Bordetella trematum]NNH21008.1 aldolase [Bordetella trematum]QIM72358.1 aldolase [Bordetella trematum]SAH99611.1 aldolase [Bordetella trematum]
MTQPDTFQLDKATLVAQSTARMDKQFSESAYTLRQKLALTCRILFDNGHDSGLAGQITCRTDAPGQFFTQQLGLGFDEITAANLLRVDEDLNVLDGQGIPNPANRFHSWVYRARPDVNCIIHTHALHTAALGMLEQPLVVSHMDNCVLYDDVAFVAKWPGIPVGNEEGELISAALGDKRALMLSHHGLLIAATSVEEACVLALAFERAARMQLLASGAGTIQPIDPALGKEAHDWILRPRRNTIAFEYYARRALKQPRNHDCLDTGN